MTADIEGSICMAVVGPCPPPLGGVAIANMNFQRLLNTDAELEIFNTSRSRVHEDLYGEKSIKDVAVSILLLLKFVCFISRSHSTMVNVFATSGASFVRDIWFILVSKLMGKKVVVHLHSKMEGELFLSPLGLLIMSLTFRCADVVFVLSEKHLEYFKQHFKASRLEVLQNYVFVGDFDPSQTLRTKEFLFVGRLTRQKGIFDLIDAVSLVNAKNVNVHVHLVGTAETDEKETQLLAYIKQKMIPHCFTFHGLVQGEEKFQLFKRYSLFVFPSHFENSPVVIKEALAARQIILCSDIDANIDILERVKSSLTFKTGEAAALALLMEKILMDESLYEELYDEVTCPDWASEIVAKNTISSVIGDLIS